jgi:hypothetical protein
MAIEHDWVAAEAHARRAIRADSNAYAGWITLALVSWCQGRLATADSAMMRAWLVDSLSPAVGLFMSTSLLVQRRYADLLAFAERARAAGLPDIAADMRNQALLFVDPDSGLREFPTDVAYVARAGQIGRAREMLQAQRARADSLLRTGARFYISPDELALAYAEVGDLDEAFDWINRALDSRTGGIILWLKVDPHFDNLRSDPRYLSALRRLNVQP